MCIIHTGLISTAAHFLPVLATTHNSQLTTRNLQLTTHNSQLTTHNSQLGIAPFPYQLIYSSNYVFHFCFSRMTLVKNTSISSSNSATPNSNTSNSGKRPYFSSQDKMTPSLSHTSADLVAPAGDLVTPCVVPNFTSSASDHYVAAEPSFPTRSMIPPHPQGPFLFPDTPAIGSKLFNLSGLLLLTDPLRLSSFNSTIGYLAINCLYHRLSGYPLPYHRLSGYQLPLSSTIWLSTASIIDYLAIHCPIIDYLAIHCPIIDYLAINCPIIGLLEI